MRHVHKSWNTCCYNVLVDLKWDFPHTGGTLNILIPSFSMHVLCTCALCVHTHSVSCPLSWSPKAVGPTGPRVLQWRNHIPGRLASRMGMRLVHWLPIIITLITGSYQEAEKAVYWCWAALWSQEWQCKGRKTQRCSSYDYLHFSFVACRIVKMENGIVTCFRQLQLKWRKQGRSRYFLQLAKGSNLLRLTQSLNLSTRRERSS